MFEPTTRIDDFPIALSGRSSTFEDCRVGDLIVFPKLHGEATAREMRRLRENGIKKTVFVDCDYPIKPTAARAADLTISPSLYLATLCKSDGIGTVAVVPEMYEVTRCPAVAANSHPLLCVWFGYFEPFKAVEVAWLRNLIRDRLPTHQLVTIWNDPSTSYQWDLTTAWGNIAACDIAVLTVNDSAATCCKSSNRAIQAMALGLPVIAYPLSAYCDVVRHGRYGLLCRNQEEWVDALNKLTDQPTRSKMASIGYRYARRYFSSRRVGPRWEQVLCDLHRSI